MSSPSAGTVSDEGRRKSKSACGIGTLRKIMRSRAEADAMLAIQSGSEPFAAIAQNAMTRAIVPVKTLVRMAVDRKLRNDFKVHLLRANVMSNVFGGDSQSIDAGRELIG